MGTTGKQCFTSIKKDNGREEKKKLGKKQKMIAIKGTPFSKDSPTGRKYKLKKGGGADCAWGRKGRKVS